MNDYPTGEQAEGTVAGHPDGPRALVVDDSATVRSYHRMILEGSGWVVSEAVNGFEGLEAALARRFDLLIVDINMPVMDGHTLVARLRRELPGGELSIIMVSTEAAGDDMDEAYRSGADLYLVKPADPEQLADCARLLVDRAAATPVGDAS